MVALVAGLCLGAIAGCSDDDSGGNNNALPDGGVDAAPDASTGESVTFVITAMSATDGTYVPAEGATVAFDAPGGERTEVVTGTDGRATFDGIDWSAGEGAVTSYLPTYVMVSYVHLTPTRLAALADPDGTYPMVLEPLVPAAPETVAVSGTATGLDDAAHTYNVNAVHNLNASSEWAGAGTGGWSIEVPRGESFILQALESVYTALPSGQGYERPIFQVMQMDHGPLTADTSGVELDFTTYAMTVHTADVSMAMPSRVDSPIRLGGIPYCYFCAGNSNFCHGWPTYLDVVDNQSRIDISFLWVEPAYVEDPRWFCRVAGDGGELAQTMVSETPQEGAQATLVDVPTWVTPTDPAVAHSLQEPMEWTWHEDVDESFVEITRGGRSYWVVGAGPNATTATVPEPPSSVDLSQLLGSTPRARVMGGTLDSSRGIWTRFAQGRSALIDP